jgi:hypothetical protein
MSMSSKKLEVSISPLFYDALSEEFMPNTDPHLHTLGRLASATIQKGGVDILKDKGVLGDKYARHTYQPSWGNFRTSTVESSFVGKNHLAMDAIRLDQPWPFDALTITRTLDQDGEAITIFQDGGSRRYELELGEKLFLAREAVAHAAEIFFAKE